LLFPRFHSVSGAMTARSMHNLIRTTLTVGFVLTAVSVVSRASAGIIVSPESQLDSLAAPSAGMTAPAPSAPAPLPAAPVDEHSDSLLRAFSFAHQGSTSSSTSGGASLTSGGAPQMVSGTFVCLPPAPRPTAQVCQSDFFAIPAPPGCDLLRPPRA